jgi:hypothetical protein
MQVRDPAAGPHAVKGWWASVATVGDSMLVAPPPHAWPTAGTSGARATRVGRRDTGPCGDRRGAVGSGIGQRQPARGERRQVGRRSWAWELNPPGLVPGTHFRAAAAGIPQLRVRTRLVQPGSFIYRLGRVPDLRTSFGRHDSFSGWKVLLAIPRRMSSGIFARNSSIVSSPCFHPFAPPRQSSSQARSSFAWPCRHPTGHHRVGPFQESENGQFRNPGMVSRRAACPRKR